MRPRVTEPIDRGRATRRSPFFYPHMETFTNMETFTSWKILEKVSAALGASETLPLYYLPDISRFNRRLVIYGN